MLELLLKERAMAHTCRWRKSPANRCLTLFAIFIHIQIALIHNGVGLPAKLKVKQSTKVYVKRNYNYFLHRKQHLHTW